MKCLAPPSHLHHHQFSFLFLISHHPTLLHHSNYIFLFPSSLFTYLDIIKLLDDTWHNIQLISFFPLSHSFPFPFPFPFPLPFSFPLILNRLLSFTSVYIGKLFTGKQLKICISRGYDREKRGSDHATTSTIMTP